MPPPTLLLRRIEDAVVDYGIVAGTQVVGEVRPRAFGTAELHLRDRRFLMRRDDTADAMRQGESFARMVLRKVLFGARYSLRDGERVLACAERRFSLSTRRDGLSVQPQAGASQAWSISRPGGLRGPWSVASAGQIIAWITEHDGAHSFAWQGEAAPEPVVAFVLFALHQQFGRHPLPRVDG